MTEKQNQIVDDGEVLAAKIALETARIGWRELQRFFAAGKAVAVAPHLDLVEVADALANDRAQQFQQWLANAEVGPVTDAQAELWYQKDQEVWAVVVAPWVLVQESQEANAAS